MPGNKALNVRLNMQVDSSQARQEVQTLAKEIKQVTNLANAGSFNGGLGIAKDINEAIKAAGNLKSALAEAVNPLTGNLNLTKFNDQLKASGMTLTDYRNQLQALGPMGTQTFNQLSRAIISAETPLLRTGKAAQTLWTTIGNTVRWQATSSLLHGVMSTASQAMNYVKNLDSSLNSIRIVTGQSQAQMEKFARTANQAAKDLNTTTNAYAQASLIYYQQGLSNKEVEDRTRTTIKLANVSGQAASKVSDQLTAIWNNFYDGSKSLEYYADVMTALGASTASSTDEIAKGLEKFSSIAKTTGLSYEYATSALSTVVAATRQSADSVGTSFKTLFSRLQGLSLGETLDDGTTLNKYSKALMTIGVNIKNANGSLKDMDTILDEIGNKWTTLSKAEQVALAQTVGGARNYTGLVSLMDNWDDFQTNLKTAQQAQGTLQNQADIYAQSWEAASKHVRSASETIYKNLLDDKVFKGLTNGFGGVLDIIGSITNGLGGFGGTMTALVAMSSRLWAPQLSKSFTNIGLNVRGLIGGQDEVLRLKQDARDQLKNFTPVTRSTEAGIIAQRYQESFAKRTDLYQKGVDNGRINQFMQPGYQLMLNAINASEDRAIGAAEQAYNSRQNLGQVEQEIRQAYNFNMKQKEQGQIDDLTRQVREAQAKLDAKTDKGTYKINGGARGALETKIRNLNTQINTLSTSTQDRTNFNTLLSNYRTAQAQATYFTNLQNSLFQNGDVVTGSQAAGIIAQIRSMVNGVPEGSTLTDVYGADLAKILEKAYRDTGHIVGNDKLNQQQKESAYASYFNRGNGLKLAGLLEDKSSPIGLKLEQSRADIISQLTKSGMAQPRIDAFMSALETQNIQSASDAYRAIIAKGGTHEEGMAALRALNIEADKAPVIGGGQAATMMTQGFASVGTTLLSAANAYKVFNDENATAGQKATALVTTMGTLPMTISSVSNLWSKWDNAIAGTSLTVGKLAGGLGVAAAAIGATVFAVKQVQLSSNASAIKALGEQAAVATQAVSDAQAKYDNLLSGRESQNNLLNKLYSLEKGTEGFSLALVNANEAARNLIDQYDLMYGEDYNYGINGEIVLNQASLNQKEQEAIDNLESVSRGKALNTYAETLLSLKEDAEKTNEVGQEAKDFLTKEFDTSYISDQWSLLNNKKGQLIQDTTNLQDILNEYAHWYFNETQGFGISFEQYLNASEAKTLLPKSSFVYQYSNMTDDKKAEFLQSLKNVFGGDLNNLQSMMASVGERTDGKTWELLSGEEITQLIAQYTNNPDLAENSEIQQRRRAAALGMIETAGQAANIQDDLTKFAIKYMESNPNVIEYQEAIAKAMYNAETTTFVEKLSGFFGWGTAGDLELLYKTLFETQIIPEDLKKDEEQLKLAVATKFGEYLNLNGLSEDIISWIGQDALVNLEGFQGLNEIRTQLEQNPILKNLTNYSKSNISDIYAQVEELSKYFNKENGQFYQNIALTLTDEISRTQTNLLQTLSTYASDTTSGNIQTIFQSLLGQYDLSQLQQITGYITQAGSVFGETTFRNLTSTLMKGVNQKTLDNLNKVNWDTTFAALNDISRLATNIGGERNIYSEILNGAIEDLGAEGGIFQKLYNSSGFQNVLENLTEQFDTMGNITAEYVNKLASKNEDLNAVLGLGRAGYANINTAGLASIFTAINAGQIKSSQVSSALLSSLSTAGALEGTKQEAFNIVDNQDFGRSGTDLLEYFTNGQKVYLNSKSQNLTFDTPLRNFFEHMMPTEVRNAYYAANENGNGKSFDQIIKDSDIPQSVKDFLNHTNKKGTKGINTWSDVIDLYGGFIKETQISEDLKNEMLSGLSPEIQAMLGENSTLNDYMREVYGLEFKNGNIHLFEREGEEGYRFTTKETEANLTKIFSQFMSPADAAAQASVWTAYIGENSSGTHLLKNDAKAAIEDLKNKEANVPGGKALYTPEEIQTAFNTYGYWAGYGANDYDEFQKAILNSGGRITPELATNFWQTTAASSSLATIGNEYSKANNLDLEGLEGFEQLLKDFGAYDQNGNISFDKFNSLIELLGGSPDQIGSILDANEHIFNQINTHFMDRFGGTHDITRKENETAEEYQQRVNREQNEANSEWFQYTDENGVTKTVHDPLGYMREHYHTAGEINKETGEAYTETGWERGYDPGLTPQSISVGADGTIYGLSQTGEVIEQGNDGKWYKKGEVPTEPTPEKSTEPISVQAAVNALKAENDYDAAGEKLRAQAAALRAENDYDTAGNTLRDQKAQEEKRQRAAEIAAQEAAEQAEREAQEAAQRAAAEQAAREKAAEEALVAEQEADEEKHAQQQQEEDRIAAEKVEQEKQAQINQANSQLNALGDMNETTTPEQLHQLQQIRLAQEAKAAQQAEEARTLAAEQQKELQGNLNLYQELRNLGLSDEDIDARLEKEGATLDSVYEEAVDEDIRRKEEQAAKEEADRLAEEQANELQAQEEATQAEEEATMVADAIGEATESAVTTTAETQNTLAENINENLSAMGEAIPGTEEYDKAFASASQYTPTDTAAEKTNDLLTDSLRQEKFIAENTQITAESTTGLLEGSEEDAEAAAKAKATGKTAEDEMVDEEGNPLEMPEGQQPSGGGGGGRGSGDTGTGGGPGGNGGKSGVYDRFVEAVKSGNWTIGKSMVDSSSGRTFTAEMTDDGSVVLIDDAGKQVDGSFASGQNNARLLAYASGKEGHIAITGELGPELRVKSDGSMDVLGKTGREYAWVEPDDKIYTAVQSAGILKSNKIPGLEGLAKGINNYIPGYATAVGSTDNPSSSSGGGGGGGGGGRGGGGGAATDKDPRYDPQTLKIRDVLERYYTILQQIDNITKAVERFSKVADRAWGRERIRAIEHQNELQQKQYEAQKKYIAEIEGYLETDQSAMTTMIREFVEGWNKAVDENTDPNNTMEKISWVGAQFDQDGVLTNYRDFVEKLVEQYNQNAASANQEVQYKFQEQLKDIQMYTDTLNLYEEQINALEDIKNAILDTAIKVVSYEVEYKLELSGDTDRILNFQADKYKDDVYQAAKYLELLDQRADLTRKNLETVTEGIMKTLGNYAGENMRVGALHTLDELGVYGTNKFEIPEELLEELDEDDEEDVEKLKELQAERSRNITKQIGAWLEEAYATNKDEVEKIEKMLSFSSEEGAGDFTYDENWRDTYDSWEDYYNEVINKTDNDTERFIDNYEEIIGRLNGLVDFQKIRTQVSDWLEELRTKDAEAAAEIDKIIRYTEDGQIANYSDVLEKLNEANVKLNDEFINLLYTDQEAFFKAMSDFQNNPGWVDFTTEHKDQLTNWMDAIYQYLESLQDTYEQTIEQLGDSIKATAKQMDAAVDEFDYYGDVYKTFGNIVDLTNRHMTDVSQDFFNTLNNKSMDNSINKIKATVTNYHLLQNELAEVTKQYNEMQARANAATGEEQIYLQQSADKLKEQLDIANNQYEDAHKAFLSSWEDALSKMAENYKVAVEEAAKNFEQGFSPLFNTLALLQAQFDREKALGDLYVDNYQRIHDLNKLNRDIQLSIDDTDNLKGKERLRDLQAEINQLQEDGTELSEYDLNILDKKYKLELARQALEDAKDAKSMVRLARDNNGNWSYVYTANQDDVDKAEQDYEDAIREMEQANEDYIDSIQDQILQVQQEAQQAILALQPEDFATYEDYLAAVNNIQNSMYQTLDFLRSQLNNAFGNNEWLDPYIVDRYGINDHDLTTDFGDTTLAGLLDNLDIDKAIKKAKENFENNLKQPVLDAFIEYSERQDEVYQAAEHDIATIGKDFQDEMENIADSSEYQVEVVTNLFERVQNSFNDMAAVVDEKTKKHLDEATMLVDVYEKLVEAITKVKELSGENLPIEGGQFIGKIDSWAEIQRLNKELAEHGDYRTLEDLTELDPEDLQDRKDAMQKASEKIGKWMETLLVDSVDEETRTAIQDMVEKDEDGLITNYKQVISKLAQLEKTDENKDILKEIKKWRATEQKAMYTSPQQVYKENEGLYTNFIAGDQFTKDYLSWITDQLMYNQMKTASDNGVTDTEKAEIETYLSAHGGVWVKKGDIEEFFDSWEDWKAWYEKNKYVAPSGGGGDGPTPWTVGGWTNDQLSTFSGGYIDTGGYTGRWQSADTGMYTGEWPGGSIRRNGRLAWLHQKELILNAHDTENFLDAMEIVRQLDNLTNWMANGLGDLMMPRVTAEPGELEQNVHIEAEFPNVTDHNEIEQAFNNLVNMASQYANRK